MERALQMHIQQGIEPIGGHVLERRVTDDSCVVDHDVHPSPGAQGGVDDRFAAFGCGDAVAVCDGLTATLTDLLGDRVGGLGVRAISCHRSTDIVDHEARAARCKQQRILLAQAAACAADHGDLLVVAQFVVCHHVTGSSLIP